MKTNTKLFFLFVVLVFFDQLSKYLSSKSICNQNIAWSISIAPAIFYLAWSLTMIFLIYLILKNKSHIQKFFILLILSGAISNIFDRIRLGCVVDYIDLKFFPVFNLADVYITIGVIAFLVLAAKSKNKIF